MSADHETKVDPTQYTDIKQKSTGSEKCAKCSSGAQPRSDENEAKALKDYISERIKVTEAGYQNLGVICAFLAGVQASILAITITQTDFTAQIVNGLFFAGLVADVGGATLSIASQRWFEMIRAKETGVVYDYLKKILSKTRLGEDEQVVEEKKKNSSFSQTKNVAGKEEDVNVAPTSSFVSSLATQLSPCVDRRLFVALGSPLYATSLGILLMVAGLMLWVCSHEALVAKVLCTVLCMMLVILLPPLVPILDMKQGLSKVWR